MPYFKPVFSWLTTSLSINENVVSIPQFTQLCQELVSLGRHGKLSGILCSPVRYVTPLWRSASRSFAPSQKSRRRNRSGVWKEALTSIIIHQTHYEKSDWSRAFNQLTIACELDMINAISAADIAFTMSSSTSAWLPSPLECSPQKQNGWMSSFSYWLKNV